ncbi:hypothetical protein [Promicromonospora sp. NPDC057488]|uniref:hypothetical protein n=1 Tax=Promicromonospora sp. NPDC057488 TaxID=3346147 RepID=UPI00366B3444
MIRRPGKPDRRTVPDKSPDTSPDDRGQALLEYVAVVGLLLLVVALVLAAATPVGRDLSGQLVCAVQSIGQPERPEDCVDGPGDGPGDDDGPGGPGDDDRPGDTSCEDELTLSRVSQEDHDTAMVVIQIGCVWYPIPVTCLFTVSETELDDVWKTVISGGRDESLEREGNDKIVDCVTAGWGDESEDPDDEECNRTMPTSEDVSLDPPKVRVGCKWLPVPQDVCDAEWDAYKDSRPGRERAATSGWLYECVTTAYDNMEPDCYVQVNTHIEDHTTSFLFFRFSTTEAVMIERLGDGRVRVHMLKGSGFGGGVSGDDIFGSPISFGVSAIDGVTSDTAYEFTSVEDAQEWISWQSKTDGLKSGMDSACGAFGGQLQAGCEPAKRRYNDHLEDEPDHHVVNDADTETKKVTVNVGIDGQKGGKSKDGKGVGAGGSAEGSYEGEVMVEDRLWDNGLYEVSYTSTDIGGFLVSGALGPGGPWGKSDKLGKLMGKGGVGATWKGSTKTTVYFDENGDLVQMYITIDDQALATLYEAGFEVETDLPYGFEAGGSYSKNKQEGTSSVQEFILDFNQYPDLREKFTPMVDELFPRDDEGKLKKGDIEIDRDDQEDGGELREALEEHGNVRELTYDDTKTEEKVETGVSWQGIDLLKGEWITTDEERVLKESSFEITDADGNKVKVEPAPRCRHEKFEPDDDYYTNGKVKQGLGGDWFNPMYDRDEGTYPGTDFDDDVPGSRSEKSRSLADEYARAFPDKNIIVRHRDIGLEFGPDVTGKVHLATVGDFYVVGLDSGTVTRKGDGGYLNWAFKGNFNRPGDNKVVKFKPRGE